MHTTLTEGLAHIFLVVLAIRTWAIWERNRRIAILLGIAFLLAVLPVLVVDNRVFTSLTCTPLRWIASRNSADHDSTLAVTLSDEPGIPGYSYLAASTSRYGLNAFFAAVVLSKQKIPS